MSLRAVMELGTELEQSWHRHRYDEAAFSSLALAALESFAPHHDFNMAELVRYVALSPCLPRQPMNTSFGEPPVALFIGRRFFIEALVWMDGTTTIHQHMFSGAFQVLQGSSIHVEHAFDLHKAVGRRVLLGHLRALEPELLSKGDTRAIAPGPEMIHSLFHLDRPSVTLVVRTFSESWAGPQYNYERPGIAYDPFGQDERLPRLLQLLAVLFKSRDPNRRQVLRDFVTSADLQSSISVLDKLIAFCDELHDIFEIIADSHPEVAPLLWTMVAERRRKELIVQWRRKVHEPEHRFLLALLLNVDGRDEIFRLINRRFPGMDPVERAAQWIGEISGQRSDAMKGASDVVQRILRDLLRGKEVDEIVAQSPGAENRDALRTLCIGFRNLEILQPLFGRTDLGGASLATPDLGVST